MKDIVEATKEEHLEVLEDWVFQHGISGIPDHFFNRHSVLLYEDDTPLCYLQILVDYDGSYGVIGQVLSNPHIRGLKTGRAVKELYKFAFQYLKELGMKYVTGHTDKKSVENIFIQYGLNPMPHKAYTARF